MNYSKQIWDQLKSLTPKDLIGALQRDNWECVRTQGAIQTFRHPDRRIVAIHLHKSKKYGYGPKLLKGLLANIGWSEKDLRRLKLIK